MKVLKYCFVSLLLLASVLFIIHPTQSQVFGQGANTTNATEIERPTADGLKPEFVPDTEDGAAPPPPPTNAITVDKLPKENPVKDPDSDTLSITNRTEILQILPANSSKIIKHVDEDLKNTTGVGLAPSDVLEKITSEKSNDNKSILQLASPEDIKKIESATSGEQPSQTREEAKQTEGQKEQAKTGAEEQALAGEPEVTNMTNATGGEQPSQTGDEQKQAGGEETNTIIGKQKQTGGEETNTIIGKQKQTKGGEEQSLNTTNVTSMLNATDSKDGNDNPEDGG